MPLILTRFFTQQLGFVILSFRFTQTDFRPIAILKQIWHDARMKLLRITFIYCLLLVLVGCQTTDSPKGIAYQQSPLWHTHHQQMRALQHFTVAGRVQVSPIEGDSAQLRFHWQHGPHEDILIFKDWLGKTLLQIKGSNNQLMVTSTKGHDFVAHHVEEAAYELLGIPLPADSLAQWIRAIPAHSLKINSLHVFPEGLAQRLHQGEWELLFTQYETRQTQALPTALILKNPDYGQLNLKIHLWQIG